MSLKSWSKISEEIIHKNPWWEYHLEKYELPNGKMVKFHRVHKNNAVVIVAITSQGKIVVVRQYRVLTNRIAFEFPMGTIENNQTSEQAAREELSQEAGYGAKTIVFIRQFSVAHGLTDQMMDVYIAFDLFEEQGIPDDTEEFEVSEMMIDELEAYIYSGKIIDQHTIATWFLVKSRVLKIIDEQGLKG